MQAHATHTYQDVKDDDREALPGEIVPTICAHGSVLWHAANAAQTLLQGGSSPEQVLGIVVPGIDIAAGITIVISTVEDQGRMMNVLVQHKHLGLPGPGTYAAEGEEAFLGRICAIFAWQICPPPRASSSVFLSQATGGLDKLLSARSGSINQAAACMLLSYVATVQQPEESLKLL